MDHSSLFSQLWTHGHMVLYFPHCLHRYCTTWTCRHNFENVDKGLYDTHGNHLAYVYAYLKASTIQP